MQERKDGYEQTKNASKDAIILAGLLGGVLLLLFSPLWGPMIWRAPASFSEPVAVSGQATKKEEKKRNERRAKTASYRK